MCCYCDHASDTQIFADISASAIPDDVLQCHHGWAEAARVWSRYGRAGSGEDVADWITLCQRRARVLAQLAVAAIAPAANQPDLRIGN